MDSTILADALRSRRGVSYRLLELIDSGKFELCVSVPLLFAYQDALRGLLGAGRLTERDLGDILDYICRVARPNRLSYLWRPFLQDLHQDMVLELAVTAGCDLIVTHSLDAYRGAELLGVQVVTPKEWLHRLGGTP